MRRFKKITALGLCVSMLFTLNGCSFFFEIKEKDENKNVSEEFTEICDELFQYTLESDSFNAHFTVTDPKDYGITFDEEDYTLGTISLKDSEEYYDYINEKHESLLALDYRKLSEDEQLTYDILCTYLEKQLAYEGTDELCNLFAPNSGIIGNLSTNFIEYQFYDAEDVEHYLLYLKDVPNYMEQIYDFTREQAPKGYFMSDQVVDQVIDMCENYINAENEPLLITFEDKIAELDISDEDKIKYIRLNEEYVEEYYLPVYQQSIDLLEELRGSGTNDGGLAGYGELGEKYYAAIVSQKTSSDMTPEEAAEYLDNAMEDVINQMYDVIMEDANVYTESLSYQPDFETPEEVLEFVLDNMSDKFPDPYTLNYAIEYQNPACEIEGTLAYYVQCRIDDISVNNIKVNGSAVEGDALTMYFTLAHEGYPGHLYQFTASNGNEDIPKIRKILDFIGTTEGWAEYASTLCADYLDISDNLKEMLYINDIFSYILCSRLDVGVNYEGWTVDEAKDYLSLYIECDDELVEDLYYTVVGDPGIYLPYTIGHLYMRDLRADAEDALGKAFDEKEYHQFLMDLGIAPFEVIENELDKWLAEQK